MIHGSPLADAAAAVTPSDTVNDPNSGPGGMFVGYVVSGPVGGGIVKITDAAGNNTAMWGMPGIPVYVRFTRVWTTTTTATGIVGLIAAGA
jgi:hypothetical protein